HWPGSARGLEAARRLSAAVAGAIGLRDRGAVAQARSWNGPATVGPDGVPVPGGPPLYLLQLTRAPAVIVESFFGSNERDTELATAARDDGRLPRAMAHAVADILAEWGCR